MAKREEQEETGERDLPITNVYEKPRNHYLNLAKIIADKNPYIAGCLRDIAEIKGGPENA